MHAEEDICVDGNLIGRSEQSFSVDKLKLMKEIVDSVYDT